VGAESAAGPPPRLAGSTRGRADAVHAGPPTRSSTFLAETTPDFAEDRAKHL
jgi:hypothetical protein